MRHVIEASTDAASLLLFDPGAFPADFDRQFRTGSTEILGRMDSEGRALWIPTERDGRFSIHVYVDESIPDQLRLFARDPKTIDRFSAPTGKLVFAGSEYAFRDDDSLLRAFPQMGSTIEVRPGSYRLALASMSYPPGYREWRFRKLVSAWEYSAWISMRWLIPVAIAAWIGLVVIFFTTVHLPFPRFLAPVLALLFALPFLARHLESYRRAKEQYVGLERELPAFVAHLECEAGESVVE
jgi:hypothetical protein